MHPIYQFYTTQLYAIRSTGYNNADQNRNGWYAVEDGVPTYTTTSPVYCWVIEPVNTDGISIIDAANITSANNGRIYDLSGRRIQLRPNSSLPKGMYIINNKKAVVR